MDHSFTYHLTTPYPYQEENLALDQHTNDAMWQLFLQIVDFWQLAMPASGVRSQLEVFMQNRMKVDLNYYAEYKNAACVVHELVTQFGDPQGFEYLLTDASATLKPAETRMARARQKVSNEFIILALSIGGFKSFGAKNALGYINGANIKDAIPYREHKE